MNRLVYIDTIRMVSPGNKLDNTKYRHFDYYLLGSFDAMKIVDGAVSSFVDFQSISRERHTSIPALYDRQPMCLYWEEQYTERQNTAIPIFEKNSGRPLIMTLVQLDDEVLSKETTPHDLINAFRFQIRSMINSVEDFRKIEFEVFYSLGEADIVLVFRDNGIRNIARLLYRFRIWDSTTERNPEGIRIMSICSLCAFPATKDSNDMFKKLMRGETTLRFHTLFNTSHGNNPLTSNSLSFDEYLLGEFDYIQTWSKPNEQTNFLLANMLSQMQDPKNHLFRTAHTIPIVKLDSEDISYYHSVISERYKSNHITNPISTEYEKLLAKYEKSASSKEVPVFIQLADLIENLPSTVLGDTDSSKYLSRKLKAMVDTLVGLLKHLIRLKEGRFESDLYAYAVPVFKTMPEVVKSYIDLINQLSKEYEDKLSSSSEELSDLAKHICALLSEYINDISSLISLLQHLFSVLSVSPHTYLETYGSNMRSIAATFKLLGAYQGIAYCLPKEFDMDLCDRNRGNQELEIKKVTTTMLILPYRSIRQSTETLFEHSSPLNRIASVSLDFADMMDIEKTLYILLHELGHHVIDRNLRITRKPLLVKTVLAYLLQDSIGSIYDDPYSCLDMPSMMQDEVSRKAKRITWSHESWACDKNDITELLKEHIQGTADKWYDTLTNRLNNHVAKTIDKSEPIAAENQFSEPIKNALISCIDDYLQSAYTIDKRIKLPQKDEILVEYLRDMLSKGILPTLKFIVNEQYEKRHLRPSEKYLWRLEELNAWYDSAESDPKSNRINKLITEMLKIMEKNYRDAVKECFCMYSDIYCDIFAFYLLRLDELDQEGKHKQAGKYLTLFKEGLGFDINTAFLNAHVLLRLEILLTKCYELEKNVAFSKIIDCLPENHPLKDQIQDTLESVKSSAYYPYIEDYANECIKSIEKKRKAGKLDEDSKKLHRMYMNGDCNNINEVVADIHYFWQASIKHQESE